MATASSLALVVGAFIYLVSLVVSVVINEITRLFPLAVHYSEQAVAQLIDAISNFQWFYVQLNLPPAAQTAIENNLQKAVDVLSGLMNSTVDGLTQFLLMLPGFLVLVLITTVDTYLIINDRSTIRNFILSNLPGSFRSPTNNVVTQLFQADRLCQSVWHSHHHNYHSHHDSLKLPGIKYILTIALVGLLDIMPVSRGRYFALVGL